MSSHSRRALGSRLILLIAILLSGAAQAAAEARHIILVIGDGMNIEHEIAASRYLFGGDFELVFHGFPYQANVATWDVTTYKHWSRDVYDPGAIEPRLGYDPAKGGREPHPLQPGDARAEVYLKARATDSASAATALATGYKTDDGNISWLPDDPATGGNRGNDGSLRTIAERLREQRGYAVGVVSTVPYSHATPAAQVSHNVSRRNLAAIGTEILTVMKPEVVIGGGHPGGDCTNVGDPDSPGLDPYISCKDYDDFRSGLYNAEYVFVERAPGVSGGVALLSAAQQAAREGKKLFGLFGLETAGNFASPQPHDLPGTPLVTRGGPEDPTFAQAALAALKVLSRDPDGFYLLAEQGDIDWANHANDYQRMIGTMADLQEGVQAIIDFVDQPGDSLDWSNTLLIVTSDHSNSYMRNQVLLGAGDLPEQAGTESSSYGGRPCTYPGGEVTYGSTSHTNELVRLYAIGAEIDRFPQYEGRWYPGTRILDNTQLFHMMLDAAGAPVPSPLVLTQ